tara:strand:+ start:1535 stop:1849 length:315 start_codon:yes stop_codon:yes gene_type:complete
MAIFNVTNKRSSSETVIPLPVNAFDISTISVDMCLAESLSYQEVDTVAYHNGDGEELTLGDVVYSDSNLTLLNNTSGETRTYNINNGYFITLDENSIYVLLNCN